MASFNDSHDNLDHAIGILVNVAVPEPENLPAEPFEEGRPLVIIGDSVAVLAAIKFDCDLEGAAGEIEDVSTYRQLPREARAYVPQA